MRKALLAGTAAMAIGIFGFGVTLADAASPHSNVPTAAPLSANNVLGALAGSEMSIAQLGAARGGEMDTVPWADLIVREAEQEIVGDERRIERVEAAEVTRLGFNPLDPRRP